MDIFSAKPISFKHHRKSPIISKLQSYISIKLLEFLGNYSDDVLAEYITVLVCNGKHQYQARDDLEAFLGEKSGEFISWLWDLLLKFAHQSYVDTGLSDPVDTVTSPHEGDAEKDSRINRSKDFHNQVNGRAHGSLAKDNKIFPLSSLACNPVASNAMEEGFQCCLGSSAARILSQTCGKEITRRVTATENINDDLFTYESSGNGGSFVISAGTERAPYMDNIKQIGKSNSNGMPNQLPHEPVCRNLQSYISEYACPRQISDTIVPRQSFLLRSVGVETDRVEKSRGSVWDRLGKPNELTSVRSKTVDGHGIDSMKQGGEVLKQGTLMLPVPSGVAGKVPGLGIGCENNNLAENSQLEHGATVVHKPNAAINIRQKRYSGEIFTSPVTGSDSLDSHVEVKHRKISEGLKKSISTTERLNTATPNGISEVLDVKQRLRQIEVEISRLRAKHAEMEKDGKPNLMSHSDKTNGKSNRFAYISFATNESVDKAMALSGTTFFSRTIKVSRKVRSTSPASRSTLSPITRKPSQAPIPQFNKKAIPKKLYYSSSHLQWRRESGSASLEPSASVNVEGKGVASSASQQQLSSLAPSVRTSKAASTEPSGAA